MFSKAYGMPTSTLVSPCQMFQRSEGGVGYQGGSKEVGRRKGSKSVVGIVDGNEVERGEIKRRCPSIRQTKEKHEKSYLIFCLGILCSYMQYLS